MLAAKNVKRKVQSLWSSYWSKTLMMRWIIRGVINSPAAIMFYDACFNNLGHFNTTRSEIVPKRGISSLPAVHGPTAYKRIWK